MSRETIQGAANIGLMTVGFVGLMTIGRVEMSLGRQIIAGLLIGITIEILGHRLRRRRMRQ